MRMRPIAIGQNREPKFSIAVSQQKRRVSRNAAAVSKVALSISRLNPPGQAKARRLVTPDAFNGSFELLILERHHLLESSFADDALAFEESAVQIRNQPVRLIEHGSIYEAGRPYRSL